MAIRLQKFLSAAGVASRRKAEELIAAGRVTVNGVRATVGMSVDPEHDEVRMTGKLVNIPNQQTTIILHKPVGYVTTRSDERGRKTVYDLLPKHLHALHYAGRLDRDSEGLLLLSDDGAFIERLTHPRNRVEKEYVVHPTARPTYGQLASLRRGALVTGRRRVKPVRVTTVQGAIHVVVHEGAKREVRSLCASSGIGVARLIRIRIGDITLPDDLPTGQWKTLSR
ncbi:MAG: pseudouridine synthase [bacterium]|nr:pseudouridine synthase [bacterium]